MYIIGYQHNIGLLCNLLTSVSLIGWYFRWSRWSSLLGKPTNYVGSLLVHIIQGESKDDNQTI